MSVKVGVAVSNGVNVGVGVKVEVEVGTRVDVLVGTTVDILVGVRVTEGVEVGNRVGVLAAVTYLTSMERKSTNPPEAEMDQDLHPDGTGRDILTNPIMVLDGLYRSQVLVDVQACNVALPTALLGLNPTITSKYETSRSKEPRADPPLLKRVIDSTQLITQDAPPSSGGRRELSLCVTCKYFTLPLQSIYPLPCDWS